MNDATRNDPVGSDGESAPEVDGSAAARGVRRAASGEALSTAALLDAMGGPLGIVEAVAPAFVFLVVYAITHAVLPSVIAPLVLSAGFITLRVVRRTKVSPAIGGTMATALSAALALWSGRAEDAFTVGLITNAVFGAVFLVSVLVRRPILGVAVSFLTNDSRTWRADPLKRRMFTLVTLLWAAMFALRLVVELPMYLAGAVEPLAVARLALGIPLYAPVVVLTFLAVQAVYRRAPAPGVRS